MWYLRDLRFSRVKFCPRRGLLRVQVYNGSYLCYNSVYPWLLLLLYFLAGAWVALKIWKVGFRSDTLLLVHGHIYIYIHNSYLVWSSCVHAYKQALPRWHSRCTRKTKHTWGVSQHRLKNERHTTVHGLCCCPYPPCTSRRGCPLRYSYNLFSPQL